jgi:two-component sensor histidine kinase
MTVLNFSTAAKPPPVDLAAEANHRIANHHGALLTIMQKEVTAMRAGTPMMPREEVVGALNEMLGRMHALSSLHRCFAAHPSQGELELTHVLTDVLVELKKSGIFGDRLHIGAITGMGCKVEASRASMLALALSEIVTNAVKYAHPTGLPVEISMASLRASDGSLVLEISDDGVGLPVDFVEQRDAGVGLKLLRSLVERCDGRLAIRWDALGLTYVIQLPPT